MTKKKDWEDVEIPGLVSVGPSEEEQRARANKIEAEQAMHAYMNTKEEMPVVISNATVTWNPANDVMYGGAAIYEGTPESPIMAMMRERLESVHMLATLGMERQEIKGRLADVDARIALVAKEASEAGLTWKEIFAALKARVTNPDEDLPTQSQLYTRARKS